MAAPTQTLRRACARFAALPWPVLYAVFYAAVVLSHLTLLRLPYFWDEGGYYIPAALDFYHRHALIPHYTNAHPPLPAVVLGTLWHITGYRIVATRLLVCAFAAAGLLAIFRLTARLLSPAAAIATTLLTAAYPIWFAQSTLAHADIFAAAFTLWAFSLYLPAATFYGTPTSLTCHPERSEGPASLLQSHSLVRIAILFSLAALSKETAILEPLALVAFHAALLVHHRHDSAKRKEHLLWGSTLLVPVAPLAAWFAYHRWRTGFMFGNPEYLRYNATANLSLHHLLQALHYRFLHLFWQRNIWVAIVFALACLLLTRRPQSRSLGRATLLTIAYLVAANWLAFSMFGGALLTRYLLAIYPLLLLVCVATWRERTEYWPWLAAATCATFVSALWLNPPTSFAPEDNLTYRDMIVVHQEAIAYLNQHDPDATVLTAWPASTELFEPFLGYTSHSMKVTSIENFTLPEIQKAAQEPGKYDMALVFTTHFTSPALSRYLMRHPGTPRAQDFNKERDLTPKEIATVLGGTIVWQDERGGEWAAVLSFKRTYDAYNAVPPAR